MKIVSLLPSATEIVYALGLGDDLEGVTFECDFPPEARTKPVVSGTALPEGLDVAEIDAAVSATVADSGTLYTLDAENIAAIDPDLILSQDLCRVCAVPAGDVDAALGALGCRARVLSLDPMTLDEVIDDIGRVAEAAGVPERGSEVMAERRSRFEAVKARSKRGTSSPRTLLLEWVDPPFSPGHWIPAMISGAGGQPLLACPGENGERTSWRAVASAEPEVIVVAPCGFDLEASKVQAKEMLQIDEVQRSPAYASDRIYAIDAGAYVARPGPRVVEGIELLALALADEIPEGHPSVARVRSGR